MVFSSILFLYIFLPVFFLVYFSISTKYQNLWLLVSSVGFYAWGAPQFILLVLGSLIVNFYIVQKLAKASNSRGFLLALSVIINIGMLAYYKYANFFVDNVNSILRNCGATELAWTSVALPIGISFFTFQSLTYSIDVYRGIHRPLDKLSDFLLYVLLFPQLIAGPIIRFSTIAGEILDRTQNNTYEYKLQGIYRFILGLAKKILIANVLGEQVDIIYAMPHAEVDTLLAWVAIVAYSFQIYFDFSGYSDMAIGLGKLMGFNFPENFNSPYVSRSISEFWRRWHITLGTWMRDYLYIPLGGNRVTTQSRLYANLAIVFILSGLWHGASWNFVIWGAWHGVFLILDRMFLVKLLDKLGSFVSITLTYLLVVVGWLFFRVESFTEALIYFDKMFSFTFSTPATYFSSEFWVTLAFAFIFSFFVVIPFGTKIQENIFYSSYSVRKHFIAMPLYLVLLIICTSYITASGFNPFIYFRF